MGEECFSAAGRADECCACGGLKGKTQVGENVGVADVGDVDSPALIDGVGCSCVMRSSVRANARRACGTWRGWLGGGCDVDYVEDALGGGEPELHLHDHACQHGYDGGQCCHVHAEGEEGADGDCSRVGDVAASTDGDYECDGGQLLHQGFEAGGDACGAHHVLVDLAGVVGECVCFAFFLREGFDYAYTAEGFFDVAVHVSQGLLRGPGAGEQYFTGVDAQTDEYGDYGNGDGAQQWGDDKDDADCDDDLHDVSEKERGHGDHDLYGVEVGDAARNDVPGAEFVVAGAVEA